MRRVFADTVYWLALTIPRDQWAEPARHARTALGEASLLTTHEVLAEYLNALSRGGPAMRARAARAVRAILGSRNIHVVPQSSETFAAAVDRYEARADKAYSLTDCASMNAMDRAGVRDVLTGDEHFAQEGYTVLIQR